MDKDQIQSEALAAVGDLRRAGIDASMGVGKTLMGIKHMANHYTDYCSFLVVGFKRSVLKAWISDMKEYGYEYLIPHMKFSTYRSLCKQSKDHDNTYLDECHNMKESHDPWLREYQGKILGLTGSPPKYKTSERGKMVDKYCPIVYTYHTDDAIDDGILNDYRIVVHMLDLDTSKTLKMTKKDGTVWYTSEQAMYTYWTNQIMYAAPTRVHMTRLMRMKSMQGFKSKEVLGQKLFDMATDKCMVFANTQDQADRMCSHSYHAKNSKSEQNLDLFKAGTIMKLSSVQQLNESVTIKELKEGIILHAFGNERVASQKIGRFLRLNPNDQALVRVLCYRNTVDEEWVTSALENFDQSKITYV